MRHSPAPPRLPPELATSGSRQFARCRCRPSCGGVGRFTRGKSAQREPLAEIFSRRGFTNLSSGSTMRAPRSCRPLRERRSKGRQRQHRLHKGVAVIAKPPIMGGSLGGNGLHGPAPPGETESKQSLHEVLTNPERVAKMCGSPRRKRFAAEVDGS